MIEDRLPRWAGSEPGAEEVSRPDLLPTTGVGAATEPFSVAGTPGLAAPPAPAEPGGEAPRNPAPPPDIEYFARVVPRARPAADPRALEINFPCPALIMCVANQKGGVGKSTTTVNLGACLAERGARVLIVDLDPQANASTGLGLDHRALERSIYEVVVGGLPISEVIVETPVANLFVAPAKVELAGAEIELVSAFSRELKVRRALEAVREQFNYVLVDCPPSLGLLTVNALAAADQVLIPIQCEYYALEGLGQLLQNIELVKAHLNPGLRVGGIVLTMFDARTRLAEQVVGEVRTYFPNEVFSTIVPRSVRLSEAPGFGQPITTYDSGSRGAVAYRLLAEEMIARTARSSRPATE
ncbi:MAG: AAA family ATPase [Actinomycetota bacterium]